jgi:hypothetical protein
MKKIFKDFFVPSEPSQPRDIIYRVSRPIARPKHWALKYGKAAGASWNPNYSALLDGVDESIVFTTTTVPLVGTESWTISAWLTPTATSGKAIFSKWNSSSGKGFFYEISGSAVYKPRFQATSSDASIVITSSVSLSTTARTHVFLTYDGTKAGAGFNIYINNVLDSSAVKSGTQTGNWTQSSYAFRLGALTTAAYFYAGTLGDIAIIPKVISTNEQTEIFNGGQNYDWTTFSDWAAMKASTKAFLVNWQSDDLTGGTGRVTDLTDNGKIGTPTNTEAADRFVDVG